jgi:hypothetical protein
MPHVDTEGDWRVEDGQVISRRPCSSRPALRSLAKINYHDEPYMTAEF